MDGMNQQSFVVHRSFNANIAIVEQAAPSGIGIAMGGTLGNSLSPQPALRQAQDERQLGTV
jgi:hypothetical protein